MKLCETISVFIVSSSAELNRCMFEVLFFVQYEQSFESIYAGNTHAGTQYTHMFQPDEWKNNSKTEGVCKMYSVGHYEQVLRYALTLLFY